MAQTFLYRSHSVPCTPEVWNTSFGLKDLRVQGHKAFRQVVLVNQG